MIAIGGSAYVIVDVSFEEDISIEISCNNHLYAEGCHVRPIIWPLISVMRWLSSRCEGMCISIIRISVMDLLAI